MNSRLIIVIGSGPGIGVATASQFASKGFHVALLARNTERLKEDAATVRKANSSVDVRTYTADVVEHANLENSLDKVRSQMGVPEVILYNAARVATSSIGEESPETVMQDFLVTNVGCYVAATWALKTLPKALEERSDAHPCFLITGGGLWEYPLPTHFSLSMQKAAQVNFAGSFSYVAKPKGIHVAIVNVGGVVSDDDPVINAKNIAGQFWDLHGENRDSWRSIVNVGDFRPFQEQVLKDAGFETRSSRW